MGAKTNRTTPRHNGISPGDGVSNERTIRRRADHDTWNSGRHAYELPVWPDPRRNDTRRPGTPVFL